MIDLEAFLKQALPEIQLSESKGIETLIEGFFIDEKQLVFVREEKYDLLNLPQMPAIISSYCNIPNQFHENFLFLDTETTGLAGGAGTIAFVVGIGFIEDDNFLIRQYFLKNQDGEEALLQDLTGYLHKFNTFVTYNGKSFDVPLLQSRFIMNLIEFSGRQFYHIDLLHIVRRLWKYHLPDCSLQCVETNLLRKNRDAQLDIPGAAIPQEYFYYLETGDASIMKRVLHHNLLDIYSLYLLLFHVFQYLSENPQNQPPDSVYYLAKWHEDCNLEKEAIQLYELIAERHSLSRKNLSFLYKKSENWEKAAALWELAAKDNNDYAFIELAKFEEHQMKQYEKALKWTEKAIEFLLVSPLFLPEDAEILQHRRQRLLRKISLSGLHTNACD
jgi:uncharacterized protein YprB with RNaseH-like and TPR domain